MLILIFPGTGSSKDVVIQGKAPGFNGSDISLALYDDYFTYTDKLVIHSSVDSSGFFNFEIPIFSTTDAYLRLRGMETVIYLTPNSQYDVELYSNKNELQIKFGNQDSTDINFIIGSFNTTYNQIVNTYISGYRINNQSKVDSAVNNLETNYSSTGDVFLTNYCRYKLAMMEQISHKKRMGLYKNKYFYSGYLLQDHPEFMRFINQFFPDHFRLIAMGPDGERVVEKINKSFDFAGLKQILAKEKLLENDTLCELVLIKGLMEVYHHPEFEQEAIIIALHKIAGLSTYPYHKKLCNNIISYYSKLSPGTKAPGFELMDAEGRIINLNDFKGKYVYLDFWASWSVPCLKEKAIIPSLMKNFGKEFEFVSISIGENYGNMVLYLKKKNNAIGQYGVYLHDGMDKRIKDSYNVRAIPTYVIIDQDGNIIDSFAKKPSEGVEHVFSELLNAKPAAGPGLLGP